METQKSKESFESKVLSSRKLSRISKHCRVEDIEEFLLQIAKYPILASQLNGYCPLSIRKAPSHSNTNESFNRLTLSIISLPTIYCFLHTLTLPLMIYKLSSLSSSFVVSATNGVASDGVALNVLAAMYILNPFIHRVAGILGANGTLEFWKTHVALLGKIFGDEFSLCICEKEIAKLKYKTRFTFFATLAVGLFGSFAFTYLGYMLMLFGIEKESGGGSQFVAKSDFSSQLFFVILPLFAFTHPLGVSLVILFPKLYSVCLGVIAQKLKSLTSTRGNERVSSESFIIKGKLIGNVVEKLTSEDEVISQVIEMYEGIFKLTREYNAHYGSRLIGEIVYSMVSVLGYTYFMFVWGSVGQYSSSLSVSITVIMSLGQMYALGSAGSRLKQKSIELLDALEDLNPEKMSSNIQWKVKMMMSRILSHPLQIIPGNCFVLNKSCLVSILSFLMSSLIVLAQFRDK